MLGEHGVAGVASQRHGARWIRSRDGAAAATLRAKRPGCRKLTEEVRLAAYAKLKEEGWSFGASCGRAKREGRPFVCKETLYRDYYARAKRGEDLPPLPRSKRKRHSRLPKSKDGRGRLPGRVDIGERPFAAELREELGHWEGDLVNGLNGTGHYVTLTERATRLTRFRVTVHGFFSSDGAGVPLV